MLLALGACKKIEASGAVCGYGDDGAPLDLRGRADGLYAVRDDQVAPSPLVTFDRVKVRYHPKVVLEVHIDTDEGNACDLESATHMELFK